MKNTRSADFCADRIDVITNFAVITNVVIKRVHCITSTKILNIIQLHKYNATFLIMIALISLHRDSTSVCRVINVAMVKMTSV